MRRNVKKIQEKYVEKGFFLAEVTYKIAPVQGSNQADVVFVINEHAKVMVKQVNLIGADKVSADDLKSLMITREGTGSGSSPRRAPSARRPSNEIWRSSRPPTTTAGTGQVRWRSHVALSFDNRRSSSR